MTGRRAPRRIAYRAGRIAALAVILLVSVIAAVVGGPGVTADSTQGATAFLPLVVCQPTPIATPPFYPPDDLAMEQSIADRINQERNANSLSALTLVTELTQAARRHCSDMAENGFTGHTGSDGTDGGQRMREAGYDMIAWGEIIAWGFGGDAGEVVTWWMNSDPHRAMILSTALTEMGVGYVQDEGSDWVHYWTVDLGKR